MAFELVADTEGMDKLLYQLLLFRSKPVWIARVYGREMRVEQVIFHPLHHDGALLIVDFVKQLPLLHPPLRIFVIHLSLELELYDGNRLVHLGYHAARLL